MPIPEPKTPSTSETPAIRPNIKEPRIVTDGIYQFNKASTGLFDLLNPGITTSASKRFCAAFFDESPPNSTHSFPNTITIPIINNTYKTARIGSKATKSNPLGGVI